MSPTHFDDGVTCIANLKAYSTCFEVSPSVNHFKKDTTVVRNHTRVHPIVCDSFKLSQNSTMGEIYRKGALKIILIRISSTIRVARKQTRPNCRNLPLSQQEEISCSTEEKLPLVSHGIQHGIRAANCAHITLLITLTQSGRTRFFRMYVIELYDNTTMLL